jgi:MarR family transcriptional regulator for hemolysin
MKLLQSRIVNPPRQVPLGLALARTAKAVSRAFDAVLVEAGGSLPVWLVLLALRSGRPGTQRELAEAVGIQGATLTHHLSAMERDGLVVRRRDPANRRVQQVELTTAGEALFDRLRVAAVAHDARLRTGLSEPEVGVLAVLLERMRDNVAPLPQGE